MHFIQRSRCAESFHLGLGRGANIIQLTLGAIRLARRAAAAAVKDEVVAEIGPERTGEKFDEILLDANRVREFGQAQALRQARDMCVHNDPFVFRKSVSENNIRGLASDPRKIREGFQRRWHLPAMSFQ